MKDTMQLVTIEEDNHKILREIATSVILPLNSKQQKFISTFQKFSHNLKSLLGRKPASLGAPQVGYPLKLLLFKYLQRRKKNVKMFMTLYHRLY
ncbi:MAG: hypothetical protein AB8W37_00015 [Arsenophonus endosymbiont of Dermacentor nuttalli]